MDNQKENVVTNKVLKRRVCVSALQALVFASLVVIAAGCAGTTPTLGSASGMTATGAAGGAVSQGASSQLERCSEPMGTLAIEEDQRSEWWTIYSHRYPQLGSITPVLRMIVQQSNCFVVVERGTAMRNVMQERELQQSGELREGSKFGKGQLVSADYTMSPSIQFAEKGTGGLGAIAGGILGSVGAAITGGLKSNEASTTLLLIDNRSGVQVAAAVGSAKNFDFALFGGLFGGGAGGGVGGFTNTPE